MRVDDALRGRIITLARFAAVSPSNMTAAAFGWREIFFGGTDSYSR